MLYCCCKIVEYQTFAPYLDLRFDLYLSILFVDNSLFAGQDLCLVPVSAPLQTQGRSTSAEEWMFATKSNPQDILSAKLSTRETINKLMIKEGSLSQRFLSKEM